MDSGEDDVIDPNFEPFENLMSDDDADTADIEIINKLEDSDTIPQPTVPDQKGTTSGSISRKKKREIGNKRILF